MKSTFILGVICLVLGSDLVLGMPAERQKRWDWFSGARDWFQNAGNNIRDAGDNVAEIAADTVSRTGERLENAADHVEKLGGNVRDGINEARDTLEAVGRGVIQNSGDVLNRAREG